ncbi:MAG: site-specific integrase [Microgenomates group bacterium]
MAQRYNFFYFEATFKKYLVAGNAGASTIKNYLSDLHFFFAWLKNDRGIDELEPSDMPNVFSHATMRAYHLALLDANTAPATYDRRLSSLRHFFSFCVDQAWLNSNPAHEFDEYTKKDQLEEVINTYRNHLVSKHIQNDDLDCHINTIRNLIINL